MESTWTQDLDVQQEGQGEPFQVVDCLQTHGVYGGHLEEDIDESGGGVLVKAFQLDMGHKGEHEGSYDKGAMSKVIIDEELLKTGKGDGALRKRLSWDIEHQSINTQYS